MNPYQDTLFDLTNQTIIVTGGTGTLGRQYCQTLASAGANVVIADLDMETCDKLAKEITKSGGRAIGVATDISNQTSVQNMVKLTLNAFGHIDILINNAGISGKFAPQNAAPTFENYPLEEWERALAVNITGMFICSQEVGRHLSAQQHGAIINVSSTYGLVGPDQRIYKKDSEPEKVFIKPVSYSATKSAVINFTRYLASYYGSSNVRVNTLTPGGVNDGSLDEEFIRKYSERTPLGRMAQPTDYNAAILFLCSKGASYMTGNNIVVDGGWTAW